MNQSICPRCYYHIVPSASYCQKCGMELNQSPSNPPCQRKPFLHVSANQAAVVTLILLLVSVIVVVNVVSKKQKRDTSPDITRVASSPISSEKKSYQAPYAQTSPKADNPVSLLSALDKMELAFEGRYTKEQIKARMDRAMKLYKLPINEENYERAGSTLVALRKNTGVKEMAILDHMIRSYVPGVKMSFPDAAAFSAIAVQAGDR